MLKLIYKLYCCIFSDVDTPEPDEKSLITYISSLYDVFPRPASHNPFAADDVSITKFLHY